MFIAAALSHPPAPSHRNRFHPQFYMRAKVGAVCAQEQVCQRGKALFPFTNFRGKQGKAGQTYHAWQLSNTYFGPHAHLGRGRVRHHNRQLGDLRLGNEQRG